MINVNGLTKYYGHTLGIAEVSFSVTPGEIFGFLGPNGAGKTTTIRILVDLLRPDSGSIELFGMPVKRNQVALRERIGYLPGDFYPYAEMTAARFLSYMAKFRARPPELRSFLLQKLNISEQNLSQKIKHLSHGTRQKLGIVFALEHQPDLAILDEPSTGLDPLVQEAFYQILREFQARGKTIFLSSHILPEVEKVCNRVAIIRQGRIVVQESIEKLQQQRPRRLTVIFQAPIKAQPPTLPAARLIEWSGNRCDYLVEGRIPELLPALARLPIADITFPAPDLEDIFLAFYAENNRR